MIYKIHITKLSYDSVNSKLLVVKLWEGQKLLKFLTVRGSVPLTPVVFKGQMHLKSSQRKRRIAFWRVTLTVDLSNARMKTRSP